MRTTLVIDDALIQAIKKYYGEKSKTEIIQRALLEMLNRLKRENIKKAYGKIDIDLDVKKLRARELHE